MASITDLFLLVGCAGPDEDGQAPDLGPTTATAETGTPPDSAESGDTGVPPDTGPEPGSACTAFPAGTCVHLTGDQEGDYAGRWVDAADLDGDGLSELMVPEPSGWGPYGNDVRSAVHILSDPFATGTLADSARVVITGPVSGWFPYWGDPSVLLDRAGQVAVSDFSDHNNVRVFDVPSGATVLGPTDDVGSIYVPAPYGQFGFPHQMSSCSAVTGTPALCVTSVDTNTDLVGDNTGQVFLYDAPLVGEVHILDARARYLGDPGDSARVVDGTGDLDADGVDDLLIGAFGDAGRVAAMMGAPDGEHRIWDVADATLIGVSAGTELGLGLASGDLDDDGYDDILAGAPLGTGAVYVSRGPPAGDRLASEAEWSVLGSDGRGLGYDLAVGDFDGDAAPDLVIGAPWSVSSGSEAGTVYLFLSPAPGSYTPDDATVALQSGVDLPDAFGMSLDVGDLDGDGRSDLVVGAPRDPTAGDYAGSATVLYGAGL